MRGRKGEYPATISTLGLKAIYDNLDSDEELSLAIHNAVKGSAKDGWRNNSVKRKKVHMKIKQVLSNASDEKVDSIVNIIAKYPKEY